MWRERFQLLVAGLFLFHFVTECGSHHGHGEEFALASAECSGPIHSPHAPHAHHHGSHASHCENPQCVFVQGKTRADSERHRTTSPSSLPTTGELLEPPPSPQPRCRLLEPPTGGAVRLHLQLQVIIV